MKQRLFLLGILLAIPFTGYCVAFVVQSHFDSNLQEGLQRQYPEASPDKIATVTVEQICDDSRANIDELCATNDNLNMMKQAALWAGIVGILLLLIIRFAGMVASNSRILLAILFAPGIYLTMIVLVGLILVHASVAVGIIYYGESALIDRIHVGVIFLIGAGAVLGALAIVHSTFSVVRKAQTFVIGRSIVRNEAPILWGQIDEIAERLGSAKPKHVVLGLNPNFFVTEANVVCLSGKLSGRTLYCSLPLARILTKQEMASIIGHELGHFRGSDTKFSKLFYPIYRGTETSLASLFEASDQGAAAISVLPAIAVLSYFLESFAVAESKLGRERELAADRAGSQIASRHVIATALVKIHAFAGYWEGLTESSTALLKNGEYLVNTSKTFANACSKFAKPSILEHAIKSHTYHPTDTHPSLATRLVSLDTTLEEVSELALDVSPSDPAILLISDYETIEEELSGAFQSILARQSGINMENRH